MKRMLFSLLGLALLLLISRESFLLGDTSGGLDEAFDESIYAYHSPIAVRAGQGVTFIADANHPDGVKKIRFVVTKRPLSVDEDGNIVYGDPTTYDSDITGHSCEFTEPYPTAAQCEYPFNSSDRWFEIDSYATYRAVLLDGNDTIHRDRKIRADIKVVTPAIKEARGYALRIYRRGIKSEKFNIVFVCDQGVATKADCHDLVDEMVATGYFKNPPPTHLKRYRRFFNLYLSDWSKRATETYENPDGDGCSDNNMDDLEESIPTIESLSWPDAWIVAHEPSIQDCSINGFSTADGKDVVVHETMHSLFRLNDEYPNGSGNCRENPHANVYCEETECVSHASGSHSTEYAASSGCRSLGTRSDGTSNDSLHWCPNNDIMVNNSSSLSTEEHSQILDYIDDGALSAFSEQAIMENQNDEAFEDERLASQADTDEEVNEKRQKTLVLSLKFEHATITVMKKKIIPGPAPHIFFPQVKRDFLVSFLDRQGVSFQSFWIQDPRIIWDEKPADGEVVGPPLSMITSYLRLPYYSQLHTIEIKDREGNLVLQESLAPKAAVKKKGKATVPPAGKSPASPLPPSPGSTFKRF